MEEENSSFESEDVQPYCLNCKKTDVELAPSKICYSCREDFMKLKVPTGIKLFACGIIVLMLIGFYRLPSDLQAGIHMERGKKAYSGNQFASAAREFAFVHAEDSSLVEANAYYFASSVYNEDIVTALDIYPRIIGQEIEDNDLFYDLDIAAENLMMYFPDSNLSILLENTANDTLAMIRGLNDFIADHPDDLSAKFYLADVYYYKKMYEEASIQLEDIISKKEKFSPAYSLLAAVHRETNEYDKAIELYDKQLALNKENAVAVAGKSRVELKRKNDEAALQLAKNALKMNSEDPYVLSTMAMVYHFSDMPAQCNNCIKQIKSLSGDNTYYLALLENIITGKETFR